MSKNLNLIIILTCYTWIHFSCQGNANSSDQHAEMSLKIQVEASTKELLTAFLVEEDLSQVEALLDDSLKFYWPNTMIDNKEGVLKACESIITTKNNDAEIIDLVIEENRAFILFVWSGVVTKDNNEQIVGKEFAIHDAWKLTWENGKVVEWYTIWGSREYLIQLGYDITPPKPAISS